MKCSERPRDDAAKRQGPADRGGGRLERDRFFSLCPDLLASPASTATFGRSTRRGRPCSDTISRTWPRSGCSTSCTPRTGRLAAELEKLVAGGEVDAFENRWLAKDGTYRWLLWSATPALDQQVIYAAARDVTERRLAEEALRESEERSRAIVDSSVDAILTIDEAGIIQSANPVVEQMFGYEHHELVGQNLKILMPSPDREEHDRHLERYVRTGVARIIGRVREVRGRAARTGPPSRSSCRSASSASSAGGSSPGPFATSPGSGKPRRRATGSTRSCRASSTTSR